MQKFSGQPLHVDSIHGPVLIAITDDLAEVPQDKARECPQCGSQTWAGSRFCRSCSWDFERAALKRIHPVKLLLLSALLNLVTAAMLVWRVGESFLR